VELVDERAGLNKGRHTSLDGGDDPGASGLSSLRSVFWYEKHHIKLVHSRAVCKGQRYYECCRNRIRFLLSGLAASRT
jgi:hypothetical protein